MREHMSEREKALIDLLRGTAIENNETELARLRKLTPIKQLEVGCVLHAAMLEGGVSELAKIKSVDDALRLLYPACTKA